MGVIAEGEEEKKPKKRPQARLESLRSGSEPAGAERSVQFNFRVQKILATGRYYFVDRVFLQAH
jgi:hypothetical protein